MWPSALAALDSIGVGDDVRTQGTKQASAEFLRADGTLIGKLDVARLRRRTGDPVYLLSRPALLSLLYGAAPTTALRFGHPVADITSLRRECDLIVVADGVFSRIRGALFGDQCEARYTGVTAWRGWIDDRPAQTMTESWGRGAKFGITPQEGGRTNWYATTAAPDGALSPDGELARLRELFGSWASPVRAVLDALVEEDILRHDLYVVPPLPTFVRGNVA
jgi:2-polyprenyl-6-methoxyphenol hydroxylase-like FAD-dependent oxidoreductase